jgi:integrase/recombinase XerD
VTHLRQMMLDELQRRNYARSAAEAYTHALREFAAYFHRPPDKLGPKEISHFQLHLLRDLKLSPQTVKQHIAAVRFFFVHTLKRRYLPSLCLRFFAPRTREKPHKPA